MLGKNYLELKTGNIKTFPDGNKTVRLCCCLQYNTSHKKKRIDVATMNFQQYPGER